MNPKNLLYILISLILYSRPSFGQISIGADTLTGCDSMRVQFSILPSDVNDTLSSIVWDFGNGKNLSGENYPAVDYTQPGIYSVSATLNGNFEVSEVDFIVLLSSPEAEFDFTDTIEVDPYAVSFTAAAQDPDTLNYIFEWDFQDGGAGNSFSLVHTFPSPGAYDVQLSVSNPYGCRDVISKNIKVFDFLKVPNVFTPNQDGYNDYFKVRTNGTNTYSFIVYSKTGAMLYRSESPVISWDGRSMFGHELRPGIYYYVIRQIDGEDPEELSGFVHLIR